MAESVFFLNRILEQLEIDSSKRKKILAIGEIIDLPLKWLAGVGISM